MSKTLTDNELYMMNDYFKALNYLSVGQLYLMDNPLLRRPLKLSDIKPRIIGHWGTVPGQNFIYMHLNRVIKKYNLNMIYISGPGHGGNSIISNTYLEGTYSEFYPNISQDEEGMKKLFKQFSFPGGTSSHVSAEVPGSINEGGELGYSLAHAYGAVLDNKDLIAACVIGDGEAETGALATSWHINKFINPIIDGAVLPILHLNGYKIANPTILARMSLPELNSLFIGYGYEPFYIEGDNPLIMHEEMAKTLDIVIEKIKNIQRNAREKKSIDKILWPIIILRTPKGWTGPKEFNRKKIENSFRAHQIPFNMDDGETTLKLLERWLKSYEPDKVFDEKGSLKKELRQLIPDKDLRMGANLCANGGILLKELKLPDFKNYRVDVKTPGCVKASDMTVLGSFIRDIIKDNPTNFRIFGPDEALSNRLNAIFEVTNRMWDTLKFSDDEFLSRDGRVMDSMLSEHVCEGLLEGYLLTGRHGFFHTYEAFSRIIDSMASQHAKWLKVTKNISWRRDIASLNFILTSHVWQQDHNGYTHQDPGFINHLVTKKADIVRVYYPFDANSLLSCFNHVISSKNYINAIIASKHMSMQWLNMDDAIIHCTKGIGIFNFASNDDGDPDIVMACCGDTPTLEILAATKILRKNFKKLKIRVVNVVDLMKLQTKEEHPHGLTKEEFDQLFTKHRPVIFAYHGYPSLIHQLSYKHNNDNIHVRGYIEEGTITTPFDMRVQNKIDRFHLVMDAIEYLPKLENSSKVYEWCKDMLIKHNNYIREYGKDLDEINNFKWD